MNENLDSISLRNLGLIGHKLEFAHRSFLYPRLSYESDRDPWSSGVMRGIHDPSMMDPLKSMMSYDVSRTGTNTACFGAAHQPL